ncbi:MAG TPA: right-handed parallel beta-helix repeat-containing protein [Solirubrobacteraceae bacterium]|nr:right-handed parallel beta-helix repeat-containing protein [Solirubrobacteraceae bacterium]
MLARLAILTTVLACSAGATALAANGTRAATHHAKRPCQRFASPLGSDSTGLGTRARPFRSIVRLDRALRPGQAGCLRAGTYGSIHTLNWLRHSGRPGHRITIRSFPGETALVRGWVAVDASYTTLARLKIDGSNTFYRQVREGTNCPAPVSQPLVIEGRNDILQRDDYFQSVPSLRGNGIGIGFSGRADNTIIRYSKIHDVGQCGAYDHLIYLSHGNNVRIYDNWLWNDQHGRGVQLYPAPTNARVFNNVIDHAGEGFVIGNDPGDTVSGNQIYNNIITDSTGLPSEHIPGEAIHDLYAGRPGTGNSFHNNDLFHNPGGMGRLTAVRAYGNTHARPPFVDAVQHDYALPRHSSLRRRHLGTRSFLTTP